MAGTIVEGRQVGENRTLTPEFCIIGSGPAGGVCALKLAEAGFDVLVLEEGPNIPKEKGPAPGQERKMLNEREAEMYKLLYQEGATRLTKNGGIKVLQGRCLGGGTAVNWSACLPPRLETLDEWQKRGLPFTRQNLEPYLREVVNYLPIVRNDKYNTSALKFMRGCDRHDIPYKALDDIRRGGVLNIARKTQSTRLSNDESVLSLIKEIRELRGDRFFAFVKKELREEVKHSLNTGLFHTVSGSLHHLPAPFVGFSPAGSFKTDDHFGNLQLTFFMKGDECVADIDIDDAGGLGHIFQVLKNHFTGSPTHPYNIHQILVKHQHLDPGYRFILT